MPWHRIIDADDGKTARETARTARSSGITPRAAWINSTHDAANQKAGRGFPGFGGQIAGQNPGRSRRIRLPAPSPASRASRRAPPVRRRRRRRMPPGGLPVVSTCSRPKPALRRTAPPVRGGRFLTPWDYGRSASAPSSSRSPAPLAGVPLSFRMTFFLHITRRFQLHSSTRPLSRA